MERRITLLTPDEVEAQLKTDEEFLIQWIGGPSSEEEIASRRQRLLSGDVGMRSEDRVPFCDATREMHARCVENMDPIRRLLTEIDGIEYWVPAYKFDEYEERRAEHEHDIVASGSVDFFKRSLRESQPPTVKVNYGH